MSKDNLTEILQIIESMQSGLVELFDQLRELRRRLDEADIKLPPSIKPEALFSEIIRSSPAEDTPKPIAATPTEDSIPKSSADPTPEKPSDVSPLDEEDRAPVEKVSKPDTATVAAARVARLLDPISHELNTGEAPAEIIAEYLLAAKEYLITDEHPNEKVSRDMDVVLKFLKARGKRGIRDEERDNILRRIKRWKAHLSADGRFSSE
ncbi:MAG: hypothetical protein GF411_05440 [Candidatus Lokiarchaeota archaeon]|nr:hypothetical protein [Candidatus Lokiarchaeota archaeon]